jgi:hypothetical protein
MKKLTAALAAALLICSVSADSAEMDEELPHAMETNYKVFFEATLDNIQNILEVESAQGALRDMLETLENIEFMMLKDEMETV